MPKTKKGHIRGIFGENPPFFGPKSCVFEIALVTLVGVRTYENILRPTQNPTLAGMVQLSTSVFDFYLHLFSIRNDFIKLKLNISHLNIICIFGYMFIIVPSEWCWSSHKLPLVLMLADFFFLMIIGIFI